jgi:hypothetical protein
LVSPLPHDFGLRIIGTTNFDESAASDGTKNPAWLLVTARFVRGMTDRRWDDDGDEEGSAGVGFVFQMFEDFSNDPRLGEEGNHAQLAATRTQK